MLFPGKRCCYHNLCMVVATTNPATYQDKGFLGMEGQGFLARGRQVRQLQTAIHSGVACKRIFCESYQRCSESRPAQEGRYSRFLVSPSGYIGLTCITCAMPYRLHYSFVSP